jgi:hypothetical protein
MSESVATVVNVSGVQAAQVVRASPGPLRGVQFTPTAAGNSIILYDSASAASGTILAKIVKSTVDSFMFNPEFPLEAKVGIVATQTGSSSESEVYI